MNDPIDVVFLDAAGTLFEVRGSVGEIYSRIARRYGVEAEPEELEEAFSTAFRIKSAEGLPTAGAEDLAHAERRWWMDVVRNVLADRMSEDILADYFHEVFEAFRSAESWELFPDTVSGLCELLSLGYRLGVISNFDSRLHDLLSGLGILSFFEAVTISWRAGASKPDEPIFRRALESMRVEASHAIHVGDSPIDDAEGAQRAGLRAVLLDRRGCYPEWKGGWRVQSMDELCRILRAFKPPARTIGFAS